MAKDTILTGRLDIRHHEPAADCDPDAFSTVVRSRRSVRVYTDDPVPEAVMRRCLDEALLAPNSSNLQPWNFYWVRSPETRAALVDACLGQQAARTAAELIVVVGRTGTWRRHCAQMIEVLEASGEPVPDVVRQYYGRLAPLAYNQGPLGIFGPLKRILVSAIGLTRPMPREPTSRADMRVWAAKTCALACQTLMLSFRANGFDTCPMEGLDSRRVRKLLGLPRDAFVVMALSVGKRADGGVYGPQIRFPREQFVFEV